MPWIVFFFVRPVFAAISEVFCFFWNSLSKLRRLFFKNQSQQRQPTTLHFSNFPHHAPVPVFSNWLTIDLHWVSCAFQLGNLHVTKQYQKYISLTFLSSTKIHQNPENYPAIFLSTIRFLLDKIYQLHKLRQRTLLSETAWAHRILNYDCSRQKLRKIVAINRMTSCTVRTAQENLHEQGGKFTCELLISRNQLIVVMKCSGKALNASLNFTFLRWWFMEQALGTISRVDMTVFTINDSWVRFAFFWS